MSSDYFNPPLNTIYSPPIKKSLMELPLKDMLWEDFEELCLRMVEYEEGFDKSECEILGRKGQKQDGIDIYARKGSNKYSTFQCKKYKSISISQLTAIFEEFKAGEWFSKSEKFYLCITLDFSDVNLQRKFEWLKDDFKKKKIKIERWDYSIINRILKNHPNIVFDFFGEEWCKQFCGTSPSELIDIKVLKSSFQKASKFLHNIKNYFENKPETHINRKETEYIINWVTKELESEKRNLFILKGEKGLGKTVILKDTYDELIDKGYNVLAIKADKYYASNVKSLEYKLFLNDNVSINRIIQTLNYKKEKLVVIIDQLDALSQTLSSKREYLDTYNRIINELIDERNIRIIISSRIFDLNYDADLRQYNSSKFSSVEASMLELGDVNSVLSRYKVSCSSPEVLELLRTPNHLEVFCKLPNKHKINFDVLSSLNDLYDKLWEDIILNQTTLNLDTFLYKIADDMYNHQRIIVNGKIKKEFNKEFNFLRSNELLIYHNDDDEIQFFHQTFYDYCFSRNFVEQGKEIKKYLFKNQQNLEIRSVVKMVFEYLREYDNPQYLKSITSILKHKKTRFHIKLLLINSISLIKNPNKYEKRIVVQIILKNKDYEEAFIDSSISKGWVELLIKENIGKYLNIRKTIDFKAAELIKKKFNIVIFSKRITYEELVSRKRNLIWKLFRNNINNSPVLILDYLDGLLFLNKEDFITNMILNIDIWKEKALLTFFEKYLTNRYLFKKREEYLITSTLIKIFEYYPEYIGNLIKKIFFNLFEKKENWKDAELSHYKEELIKEIDRINTDYAFQLFFDTYKEIIEKYKKKEEYEIVNSSLYSCSVFSGDTKKDHFNEAYLFLENYFVNYLNKNRFNGNKVLAFFNSNKNSNSIYILRILVLFLIENYENYKKQVLEIFDIVYEKNGFNGPDDKFQLYFRNLINKSFLKLPLETKSKIVEIILSIRRPSSTSYHSWEDKSIGKKRAHIFNYGKKLYLFICSIPNSEKFKYVELNKKHQEFERKYGKIKYNSALDISEGLSFYSVGPPIKTDSYKKLTLKNWKESMLKFDDSYQGRGAKGGKSQHKEEFKKRVEIEPNKYYNFLLDLVDTRGVSIDYFIAGIDGLMFANYDIKKVKILFIKLTKLDLDYWGTLNLIWKVKIFIDNNLFDDGVLAFMIDSEKKYYEYEKQIFKEGKKHNNSNSIRGAICDNLICCNEYNKYENIIFEFIEESINNEIYDLGNIIILKVAYLKAFDKKRSFSIFKKLVDTDDIELLKLSVNQSQYFNKGFHFEMIDYFKKIMNSPELNIKGEVIVLSWLDDSVNDLKLYQEYIETSDEAKLCAIRMAENHLEHEDEITRNRALDILFSFLNQKGEKFAQEYSGVILRKYKKENFKKSLPFLRQYSVSNVCHERPYYFIELLLEVSKDYPNECLDLIENINLNKIDRGFSNRDPTNVVLAIYSKLMKTGIKNEKKNIDKALDMFDDMLKHSHLRIGANKAIELTI